MMKAGAQRRAEELGLIIVAPDTSPRNRGIEQEKADWRLGEGASFYVNAKKSPWHAYYQMYDYIAFELPKLIDTHFKTIKSAIMGHSMGGMGALVVGLKNQSRFESISALSPICSPTTSSWGQHAFLNYLGDDKKAWLDYDPAELLKKYVPHSPILIDQGGDDEFLIEQLKLDVLEHVVKENNLPVTINRHAGYDHSYYFVSTCIASHLEHHFSRLAEI